MCRLFVASIALLRFVPSFIRICYQFLPLLIRPDAAFCSPDTKKTDSVVFHFGDGVFDNLHGFQGGAQFDVAQWYFDKILLRRADSGTVIMANGKSLQKEGHME